MQEELAGNRREADKRMVEDSYTAVEGTVQVGTREEAGSPTNVDIFCLFLVVTLFPPYSTNTTGMLRSGTHISAVVDTHSIVAGSCIAVKVAVQADTRILRRIRGYTLDLPTTILVAMETLRRPKGCKGVPTTNGILCRSRTANLA